MEAQNSHKKQPYKIPTKIPTIFLSISDPSLRCCAQKIPTIALVISDLPLQVSSSLTHCQIKLLHSQHSPTYSHQTAHSPLSAPQSDRRFKLQSTTIEEAKLENAPRQLANTQQTQKLSSDIVRNQAPKLVCHSLPVEIPVAPRPVIRRPMFEAETSTTMSCDSLKLKQSYLSPFRYACPCTWHDLQSTHTKSARRPIGTLLQPGDPPPHSSTSYRNHLSLPETHTARSTTTTESETPRATDTTKRQSSRHRCDTGTKIATAKLHGRSPLDRYRSPPPCAETGSVTCWIFATTGYADPRKPLVETLSHLSSLQSHQTLQPPPSATVLCNQAKLRSSLKQPLRELQTQTLPTIPTQDPHRKVASPRPVACSRYHLRSTAQSHQVSSRARSECINKRKAKSQPGPLSPPHPTPPETGIQ